jgi:hypothetical protein
MPPRKRLLVLVLGAACAVPLAGAAPAAAATCGTKYTKGYPGQGYFTSLKVTAISCSGGRSVMLGHHRCRTKKGIKGRCARFNGWKCSEVRPQAIATEYNARVTCKKGSRKVVYTYQQDT